MIERLGSSLQRLAEAIEPDEAARDASRDFADAWLLASDCPQVQLAEEQARRLGDLDEALHRFWSRWDPAAPAGDVASVEAAEAADAAEAAASWIPLRRQACACLQQWRFPDSR